ncbi:protein C2-DOMAIN ABA-RELATED 3-like isoform X2 [Musa acuminata AAA Group]|uniref:protein C2-DOMAIN ABA-RELATED 3 isoform X2 n=1 Tax=Musa acuminata AAA Group TaxID=214697 RepID=UPI0008A0AC10|nr:PREDICTED: protein C2-DOMAIN ABA-RELATED 3-like isoform X2 [Musa acuminata subsp. malaccensis]
MEHMMGLLRVRVVRGVNLAYRDARGSDPYVVMRMGGQQVYDKDTFSRDDKMGDAEIDIQPFVEAVKMNFSGLPNGTIIKTLTPNRQNCLAEESAIVWKDDMIVQDVVLRLRNVESGELELQLNWINIPGALGL